MLRASKNFKYDCTELYAIMFHLWFIVVYVIYQICAVTIAAMSEYVLIDTEMLAVGLKRAVDLNEMANSIHPDQTVSDGAI